MRRKPSWCWATCSYIKLVKNINCFTFGGARDQGQGFLFSSQFCNMLGSKTSLLCAQAYRSAQQSFNFCLELRCKSSTLYASGTNNSCNKLDRCWVRPPSTALMTSLGLPEALLFDDCAKGRLLWNQHLEYGQEKKERDQGRLSSSQMPKKKIILCFLFI